MLKSKLQVKDQKELLGIFDSGVGGFSVLQGVRKATDADIHYFGDCARAPYGNRDEEEIVGFIKDILLSLKKKGVTHFVSACNSMSVHTAEKVLEEAGITRDNYIDMVDAIKKIPFPKNALVLIVGTQATISSGVYQAIFTNNKISSDIFIPTTLAGEIERDDDDAISVSVSSILKEAQARRSTHIVYACTHYPLIDELFKSEAVRKGWSGEFIDPAVYVAEEVKKWELKGSRDITFETSEETPVFKEYSAKVW